MLYKKLGFKVKEFNDEDFTIRAIFSTADIDRHGEIIDQTGWDLKEFLTNPVVLFAHDQYQPAIGQVTDIGIVDGNLEGTIKFAAKEYEFANTIYQLYKGKFMRAISVGFENVKYEYDEANDQIILRVNILYEVSCVNVPAQAMALAKSQGVDIEPLEKLIKSINEKIVKATQDEIAKNIQENIIKTIRTDKPVEIKKNKVETPIKGEGCKKWNNRQINKAIRNLLKERKNNEKSF